MTNVNHAQALADFLADTDVESLREQCLTTHGIDIRGVYCLHTGRLVGTFSDFVLQFAIDEESSDDDESLIDALMVRTVASMRPTPMLNKPDRITLLNLAAKFPVDILCYLANRLASNRWLATHRAGEIVEPYLARIHLHQRWSELALKGVDLRPWIHWLLELDAKTNLHDTSPLTVERDQTGKKWLETKTGESIFHLVTKENEAELLAILEKWAFGLLEEYDRRDKQALAQARWARGNSMTQPAYSRSWLDNPEIANRKHAEALAKKNKKAANPKPKSEKAQKLDAKVSQFLGLLDDVLDGKIEAPTPVKKAQPLTGAMLFKKKES